MTSSENNNTKKSGKRIVYMVLSFVIFPLLVLLPLLTVYLSSSGLKANKKLKAEMKSYKDSLKLPSNEFLLLSKNKETNLDFYKDKVLVISFYDKDCNNCDSALFEMKRIQNEFSKKTKRIHLITYVLKDEPLDSLKRLIEKFKPDTSSWDILVPKDNQMNEFLKQIKVDSAKAFNTLVLADRKGIIANYYIANKTLEVNNLMRHATMLLPAKEDRKKIKYKREQDIYQ
jgi:cytochrome oxidase Cu insertion factor (SCO1/SenC/PrrC family)